MLLPKEKREELTRLRVLRYLSHQPLDVDIGEGLKDQIREALLFHAGLPFLESRQQIGNLYVLLPQMQEAGLIGRRSEPDPRNGKSRPYFITDAGRRYLADAVQNAMHFEPGHRIGWADEVVRENHKEIAAVIRGLPEFEGSSEARIQEVSRAVAEAVGLSTPQTGRADAEHSGR